jgi:Na+/melibiose symporter-like transporter
MSKKPAPKELSTPAALLISLLVAALIGFLLYWYGGLDREKLAEADRGFFTFMAVFVIGAAFITVFCLVGLRRDLARSRKDPAGIREADDENPR